MQWKGFIEQHIRIKSARIDLHSYIMRETNSTNTIIIDEHCNMHHWLNPFHITSNPWYTIPIIYLVPEYNYSWNSRNLPRKPFYFQKGLHRRQVNSCRCTVVYCRESDALFDRLGKSVEKFGYTAEAVTVPAFHISLGIAWEHKFPPNTDLLCT